jgi:proteasome lid subunit RPN8/RPN11
MADWKVEAEAYAKEQYPREACGLVVVIKGRKKFWPCENKAQGTDHFIIEPEDYAAAEDAGTVVAVWHSHCNITPQPSDADLVSCEKTAMPWHIYAWPADAWHTFSPTGYKAPLIGRQFQHGVLDCYAIIKDWYADELGVTLPEPVRKDDWWLRGENLYIDNFEAAGFVSVSDGPQHGDVLLMQVGSPVPNHGAVWLEGDMIVHHMHGRLSSRDVYGGWYRKITVKILRYVGNA